MGMVTLPVGWLPSTTVNEALPPCSSVSRPLVGLTMMAAESLSVIAATTLGTVTLP
jgi:hypothetical protein